MKLFDGTRSGRILNHKMFVFWRRMFPSWTGLPIALLALPVLALAQLKPASATESLTDVSPYAYPAALLEQAAELRERAINDSDPFAIVASLSSEIGPRLAGSDGDRAAVAWALNFLQDLKLDRIAAQGVLVPRWERGEIRVRILSPSTQNLTAVALGGSVGTAEGGLEAPVLRVPDLDTLREMSTDQVAGHVVFIDQSIERSKDASGYSNALANRSDGASVAARLGAVGLAIRSLGTDSNRLPHTGRVVYADRVARIPAVALSAPDADILARQFDDDGAVILQLMLSSRSLGTARSANVIGEIRGQTQPDEIVLLGAHLDAWDLGTGALDNGTGVAIVTETMRLIAMMPTRPARTVRVVLFADEELSLSGAKAYAARNTGATEVHVLGMEPDGGSGRVWRLDGVVPQSAAPLLSGMAGVLKPLDIPLGVIRSKGGGEDLAFLRQRGMPEITPRQDYTYYFDYHHSANDTLDKVDPAALRQVVAAYAAITWLAANTEASFGRLPVASPGAPPPKPAVNPQPEARQIDQRLDQQVEQAEQAEQLEQQQAQGAPQLIEPEEAQQTEDPVDPPDAAGPADSVDSESNGRGTD
ncbi:MAG: M20/M25/M40 family metallo-hydrolase [Gammaproteobacteria bacterium]